MTSWFGHTQTVASISKSVTTVAGGCMALESNFADFMKKVIYYERFVQRMSPNLPEAMLATARRLFARCYEYRDEIRNELESNFAYVADAGRWIVGLEDWNSKFQKRLMQIQELVLLINTLLIEYAVLGRLGAEGSRDELDAYLRVISGTVVLQDEQKSTRKQQKAAHVPTPLSNGVSTSKDQVVFQVKTASGKAIDCEGSNSESGLKDAVTEETNTEQVKTQQKPKDVMKAAHTEAVEAAWDKEGAATTTHEIEEGEDDDQFNPFATDSAKLGQRKHSFGTAIPVCFTAERKENTSEDEEKERGNDSSSSSSNLSEYECLDTDSIPKYVAFRPSVLSRRQRQRFDSESRGSRCPPVTVLTADHALKRTKQRRSPRCKKGEVSSSDSSTSPRPRSPYQASPSESFCSTSTSTSGESHSSRSSFHHHHHHLAARAKKKLMDLSCSYDLKTELTWNPFVQRKQDAVEDESEVQSGQCSTVEKEVDRGSMDSLSLPPATSTDPDPSSPEPEAVSTQPA